MDEKSQTVIMQSIQDLERIQGQAQSSITTSFGVDQNEQIQQLIDELQSANKARDQMTQRCLELDSQVIIRINFFYIPIDTSSYLSMFLFYSWLFSNS